jgi:SAM-dependent methyltransferase
MDFILKGEFMTNNDYKPTERFSTKARFYHCRPDYTCEIINRLQEDIHFSPCFVVADIGSGTGKLAKIFVDNGNEVFGVEPNSEMRRRAEKVFKNRKNFHSIEGSAENTGLPPGSMDFISIGQALHWFDLPRAKKEFLRILKTPGYGVVLGNRPLFVNKNLAGEVGALTKKYCYKNEKRIDFKTIDFIGIFRPFQAKTITMTRRIRETVSDIINGTLSCSFSPDEGDADFREFVDNLESTLLKYAVHHTIEVDVETKMTLGRMK